MPAERFCITLGPDRKVTGFDRQCTEREIKQFLTEAFGLRLHHGILRQFDKGNTLELARVLRLRGESQKQLEYDLATMPNERLSMAAFTANLPVQDGTGRRPDYIIFWNQRGNPADFPATFAEEVTHAEHECSRRIDQRMSQTKYYNTFHEITHEVIGYLGRSELQKTISAPVGYGEQYDLMSPWDPSHIAHMLSYTFVDKLREMGVQLPLQELFRAKDEKTFWEIIRRVTGTAVYMTYNISQNWPQEAALRILDSAEMLIRQAKCQIAMQPSFVTAG